MVLGVYCTSAGSGDWHRHRRALGVPDSADFGVDTVMWLETNAVELNGVSFTKGCYVGQENTARMHHRDRLRKRILPVRLPVDPGDGTTIMAGEREAGTLMSHSGGDGFALMRLEFAGPGIALMLNNAPVNLLWPGWLPPLAATFPKSADVWRDAWRHRYLPATLDLLSDER